jgi:hypothetical protein
VICDVGEKIYFKRNEVLSFLMLCKSSDQQG